jgi:hypothetical protein
MVVEIANSGWVLSIFKSLEQAPRRWRIGVAWGGTFLCWCVGMPIVYALIAYFVGVLDCGSPAGAASNVCSPPLKTAAQIAAVGVALACFVPVMSWFQKLLVNDQIQPTRPTGSERKPSAGANVGYNGPVSLSLGQILAVGRIEVRQPSGRTVALDGQTLTLWSLYPIHKGFIKQNDELAVVYQRLPFTERSKFLVAYYGAASNHVQGVAATVHLLGIVLMSAAATVFWWLSGPRSSVWLVACGAVAVVNITYLVLMVRAKRNLRAFLSDDLRSGKRL